MYPQGVLLGMSSFLLHLTYAPGCDEAGAADFLSGNSAGALCNASCSRMHEVNHKPPPYLQGVFVGHDTPTQGAVVI